MQLQNLLVSECYESETNPRGTDFEGKQFDELVASVKEKGVLVPVLARAYPLKDGNVQKYEVIAGNRRLRAAKKAGLKEIPAQVVKMTDEEAREAQIVENLQRQDVHPLEEGEAYRQLIEDGGRTVKDVAVKVGKSETYVRQRLFLTNLSERAGKLYRKGEIADAAVLVIARLSPKNQDTLIHDILYDLRPGEYDAADVKRYIEQHFSNSLDNQPWLTNAEIAKIVGACKECPPNRAALFGNIKQGQCTDLKCWTRKMGLYLDWIVEQNPEIVAVSDRYGTTAAKSILSKSQYEVLGKKGCEFEAKAVVIEGDEVGKILRVCFDKDCKEHRLKDTEYAPSEKEKANRQKERDRDNARRVKFDIAICDALNEVKYPLSEKHLDVLLDFALNNASANICQPLLKRHGLKAEVKKENGYTSKDFRTPLREMAQPAGNSGKLRLIFELLLPTYWSHGDDREMKKKIAKL
jgi:ParB family chromosome partitioning protein